MLKIFVLLVCLSVTLGVGYSANNGTTSATMTTAKPTNGSTTAKPTNGSTTAKPTNGSTTAKPTNGSTTAKPTNGSTTAKPTNGSTTAKPTNGSTTAKPTNGSTTVKPTNGSTTAKPTNGSTTAKPSNVSTTATPTSNGTTTTAKTTTAVPTPTTPPPYGIFSFKKNGSKEYCLLAEFAVTFNIHYLAEVHLKDNSSKLVEKNATIYLDRANNDKVSIGGKCGNNKSELILSWPKSKYYYTLTMVFRKTAKALEANAKSDKWRMNMITLLINLDGNPKFPNAKGKSFTASSDGSSGPTYNVGGYYSCLSKNDNVKFDSPTNYTVDPVFEYVKLEPFVHTNKSDEFEGEKFSCYQDNPTTEPTTKAPNNNDIVPIAVGCALAGLVLIVLIAYIIGRRKSHRGYEKV